MAERDLLNKFLGTLTPVMESDKASGRPAPAPVNKLGVAQPSREVGREPGEANAKPGGASARQGPASAPAPTEAPPPAAPAAKAYRAAYFNRDVQAAREVNLAAAPQKALRGEEGASDLKRVVLPRPEKAEAPSEPAVLEAALGRMASPSGDLAPNLAELLERQSQWSQLPSVKAELIEARRAMLEAMVAARRTALARMRKHGAKLAPSDTIQLALDAEDNKSAGDLDGLAAQGNTVIEKTAGRAAAMAKRLAKVVRSKL